MCVGKREGEVNIKIVVPKSFMRVLQFDFTQQIVTSTSLLLSVLHVTIIRICILHVQNTNYQPAN
jgi:hypothetical protein